MKEKQIEQKLVRKVKTAGGIALKLNPIGMDGIPDRLLLMPGGKAIFCELKAPGKKPRPLQIRRMEQLSRLGFQCHVIDDQNQIDEVVNK